MVLVLGACGVSSTDGVMARSANKGGLFGLSKNDAVMVDGASSLAEVKNVVIGSFKVGFSDSSKEQNKASGSFLGGSSMGGKATGYVKLEGVSAQDKQAITEAAYADFVQKLKSNGYNVIERSTLTSSEQFQNAGKTAFPYVSDQSGFLSSYGQTYYYQPASFGNEGFMLNNDIPGETSGLSAAFSSADTKMIDFAAKNNVAVISATYLIDFAATGGHSGVSTASLKVGQNLAVTDATVKFIKGPSSSFSNGAPSVKLGQPVESGKEFGTLINDTSGGNIALQEAGNIASVLMGQGTNRSRDYVIQADPARFKEQSVDVLTRSNTSLLATAAAAK